MTDQQGDPSLELSPPFKRRKFYRKRADIEDEDGSIPASRAPQVSPELLSVDEFITQNEIIQRPHAEAHEESHVSVAEILRQRKAAQRRRGGGIEFTNHSTTSAPPTPQPSDALIEKIEDDTPADIKSVIERFAPQTGQVTEETDKHMMAYIDTELAKRHCQDHPLPTYISKDQQISYTGALIDAGLHRQPAALGKLHEIDLGPDATLRNIARTAAAQRRLDGLADPEIDQATGRIRLRRDGKPWGRRRRRNSEDIKRDKLVEEVMKEGRLDIYDELDTEAAPGGNDDDQAADDRIAEQFRREFMDAISQRRKRVAQAAKSAKGKVVDAQPRGPKLGGSRSARAAMKEREEAAAAAKKR